MSGRLGLVTVTVDPHRADPCVQSWFTHAAIEMPPMVVVNIDDDPWRSTVQAFGEGVDRMMRAHSDVDVICCLHDDLVIFDPGWDERVLACFDEMPEVGLAGFVGVEEVLLEGLAGGGVPHQLVRRGVRSQFEPPGEHAYSRVGTRVASVDGVALLGRRAFWSGFTKEEWTTKLTRRRRFVRPWLQLAAAGFTHHWTDDALACLARRAHWDVYYLPVRGRHLGGLTIRDPRYHAWAAAVEGGDRGFQEAADRLAYDLFRDVLPLRAEARSPKFDVSAD